MSDKAFARLFHDLPLAALGLEEKTVADMARAGLAAHRRHRAEAPRADRGAVRTLIPWRGSTRSRASSAASISPRFAPPDFCAERRFASPIQTTRGDRGDACASSPTISSCCSSGRPRARGGSSLRLYRVDGACAPHPSSAPAGRSTKRARSCGSSPSGLRVRTKTPSTPATASISCVSPALRPSRSRPPQAEFERAHEAERALVLAELLDRLSARLGARAVTRRELVEAHLPEQAEASAPATLGEARLRGESRLAKNPWA